MLTRQCGQRWLRLQPWGWCVPDQGAGASYGRGWRWRRGQGGRRGLSLATGARSDVDELLALDGGSGGRECGLRFSPEDLSKVFARLAPRARRDADRHRALAQAGDGGGGGEQQEVVRGGEWARELRRLEGAARRMRAYEDARAELAGVRAMRAGPDVGEELLELVREEELVCERKVFAAQRAVLEHFLKDAAPKSAPDPRVNAIMELRAGTGGEEAALFVGDLLSMYLKYFARRGWKSRILSSAETGLGGFREVVLKVMGSGVYERLNIEAGVHRVQRVPRTEASGRVHTSTASVAVLKHDPTVMKKIAVKESDVRMDVYRASGAGGQHVNKTESAVRLTHVPTGLVVTSQEDRSQHRNKAIAMEALVARIAAKQIEDEADARAAERRMQLGKITGERSDRIRTYNYPQGRVTDHRVVIDAEIRKAFPSLASSLGNKNASLSSILDGSEDLDRLMDSVKQQQQVDMLMMLLREGDEISANS